MACRWRDGEPDCVARDACVTAPMRLRGLEHGAAWSLCDHDKEGRLDVHVVLDKSSCAQRQLWQVVNVVLHLQDLSGR